MLFSGLSIPKDAENLGCFELNFQLVQFAVNLGKYSTEMYTPTHQYYGRVKFPCEIRQNQHFQNVLSRCHNLLQQGVAQY